LFQGAINTKDFDMLPFIKITDGKRLN